MEHLLVFAHGGSWDRRYQVSALAASAAASGARVDVALFFAALDAWVGERWDALDPAPPLSAERLAAEGAPSLAGMIAAGREAGTLRLYACSASMRFLGLDTARVQERVDLILGWQSFARMAGQADRVVTF